MSSNKNAISSTRFARAYLAAINSRVVVSWSNIITILVYFERFKIVNSPPQLTQNHFYGWCMGWRIPSLAKSTNFLSHQV